MSLAHETQFIPIPSYSINIHSDKDGRLHLDNLLPVNYFNNTIPKEENSDQKQFTHPKIIQNSFTLRSGGGGSYSDPNDRIINTNTTTLDKESINQLITIASNLDTSVKYQNLQLKKEVMELKEQISQLIAGKGSKEDYDSIHKRLSRIQDETEHTSTTPIPTQIDTEEQPLPIRTIKKEYTPVEPTNVRSSFSNVRNSSSKVRSSSSKVRSSLADAKPKPPKVFRLKKKARGVKRYIRTGEEELYKKM